MITYVRLLFPIVVPSIRNSSFAFTHTEEIERLKCTTSIPRLLFDWICTQKPPYLEFQAQIVGEIKCILGPKWGGGGPQQKAEIESGTVTRRPFRLQIFFTSHIQQPFLINR